MSVHDIISLLLVVAFMASVHIKSESDPQNFSSNNWIIGPVTVSESGNLVYGGVPEASLGLLSAGVTALGCDTVPALTFER